MATMTPHECIQEALVENVGELDETLTQQQQLHQLSESILQYLDSQGYTLVDVDAIWSFYDSLEEWLNQDSDAHRLSTFTPYEAWMAVWRHLPRRQKYDIDGSPVE